MTRDDANGRSWFHRHPAITLAAVCSLAVLLLVVGAELVLRIKKAEGGRRTSSGLSRSIRLKEHGPNMLKYCVPTDDYMAKVDSLVQREYVLRTDKDGFIMPSRRHEDPDLTVVFLGGSSTQCKFVEEENRFPCLVGTVLESRTGMKINSYNGGVSGNHSMHSLDALINKVMPIDPDVVVMMHNVNDLNILLYHGSYWNDNPYRSLVQLQPRANVCLLACFRTFMRWALPNLTSRYYQMKQRLDSPERIDEFAHIRGKKLTIDRGWMVAEFKTSLNMFVSVCRARQIVPVLMTQASRLKPKPDALIEENLRELFDFGVGYSDFKETYDAFNEAIREVAAANQVLLIDLANSVPQESKHMYDPVHYNDTGCQLAASIIAEKLINDLPSLITTKGADSQTQQAR